MCVILTVMQRNQHYKLTLILVSFLYAVSVFYFTLIYGGRNELVRVSLKPPMYFIKAILSGKYRAVTNRSVLKALGDAGLSCIALKGWELRKLYPEPMMRQVADLDILVRPYDFDLIKSVMEKLGFTGGSESSWKHDSFKKNEVHVEMHKRLTDDSEAIQAWEKGLWDRAVIVEGNIYRMSPEDYYIFHFIHLHKGFYERFSRSAPDCGHLAAAEAECGYGGCEDRAGEVRNAEVPSADGQA